MDNSKEIEDELQVSATQEDEETFDVLPDMTPAQLRMFLATPSTGESKGISGSETGTSPTTLPPMAKAKTHANTNEETVRTEDNVFHTEVSVTEEEAKAATKSPNPLSVRQKSPSKVKKDSAKQLIFKSPTPIDCSNKRKKGVNRTLKTCESLNPPSPISRKAPRAKVRTRRKTEATSELPRKKPREPIKPKEIRRTFRTAFAEDKTFISTEEAFTEYEIVDAKIRPFVFKDSKRWVRKQTINLNRKKPLGIASDEIGSMRERRVQTPSKEFIGQTSAEKPRSQREIPLEFKKCKPFKKTARKSSDKRDISVEVREENVNQRKVKGSRYWFFGRNKAKISEKSDSQVGSSTSGQTSSTTSASKFSSSTN
ncbi:unnamed protein product [Bursaphelenchus xylophilus]|uniref:(pine wood nematode) hypothetical protein n=1 Tax=Bursaphelenchus xylophilus TaxID=6326 RepID=A0A1I7RLM3_BURXY|nr:unnamed protein product [Bursaphelenchus xylophilus]CAG9082825.1 unnamed protein product [Bursaphelenchus xylophilus]